MPPENGRPRTNGIALDQLFDALSHRTRRRILITLAETNPREGKEFESVDSNRDDEASDPFKQPLYHNHLPRLADAEFIDWDRETNTVTRGPRFEEVEPLLKLMYVHQDELPDDWL